MSGVWGWLVDFLFTTNRTMTINADSTSSDGYLAGAYGAYESGLTLRVPGTDITIEEGRPLPVVLYGFLKMGYAQQGVIVYEMIHDTVQEFGCGVNFSEEFLEEGPVKVTLELRMINPEFLENPEFWSAFTDETGKDAPTSTDMTAFMNWYEANGATLLENMDLILEHAENYLVGESYTFVVNKDGTALQEWDIEYEDEDGSILSYEDEPNPSNYTVNSLPITLKDPVKEGYDFAGWEDENGEPVTEKISEGTTGDKKYVATWTIKEYDVTFETNGDSTPPPLKVKHGKTVSEPSEPTKEGYRFENWYSDSVFEVVYDFNKPVTQHLTLYANWTANTYTVTFNANGGSVTPESKTVTYGSPYGELPTPEWEGHTFKCWSQNSGGGMVFTEDDVVMSPNDHTLYAIWEVNSAEGDVAPPTSGGGGGDGGHLSFPRTTENGGLVDFGSSKVVKAVLLPEGSRGSVLLKVDTVEKWPKELETEYTFDISVEKLGEGMAYIHFEISESTLESLGITPADICAYHLVDDVWVKLITTYEVKDGTVFYEAETDSFSPFKLVIEEGAAEPKAEETEPVIPPTEEPENKPEDIAPPLDPPVQPTEPESPSPILAVLAGLGAAAVLRRK